MIKTKNQTSLTKTEYFKLGSANIEKLMDKIPKETSPLIQLAIIGAIANVTEKIRMKFFSDDAKALTKAEEETATFTKDDYLTACADVLHEELEDLPDGDPMIHLIMGMVISEALHDFEKLLFAGEE